MSEREQILKELQILKKGFTEKVDESFTLASDLPRKDWLYWHGYMNAMEHAVGKVHELIRGLEGHGKEEGER